MMGHRNLLLPLISGAILISFPLVTKAQDNNCLNLEFISSKVEGNSPQHKYKFQNGLKTQQLLPFILYNVDYNNDGKKESILIGSLKGKGICDIENYKDTLQYWIVNFYKFVNYDSQDYYENFVNFVRNLDILNDFRGNFSNILCKMWNSNSMSMFTSFIPINICSSSDSICNDENNLYYFAIDTNANKFLWIYPLKLSNVVSYASGPVLVRKDNINYVGFTYVVHNTQYELHLILIPLEENIASTDINDIVLKTSSSPLEVGKLYTSALDWDLDGEDDVLFIPYYTNTGANNWRSHILAINVKDSIDNWRIDERDFDMSSIIRTNVVSAFWYGKPYLFFGANRDKLNGRLEHIKIKDFFAVSLCDNSECNFNTIDINPNNYIKDISVDFKRRTYTNLSDNECGQLMDQHRGLHFKMEKGFGGGSKLIYQILYDKNAGYIDFISANPIKGIVRGFKLKVDTLISTDGGYLLVGNNYIFGVLDVNAKPNLNIKFKEGEAKLNINLNEINLEESFKNTAFNTQLETNVGELKIGMGQGLSLRINLNGVSGTLGLRFAGESKGVKMNLHFGNPIEGKVKFGIQGPHPILQLPTETTEATSGSQRREILFWLSR